MITITLLMTLAVLVVTLLSCLEDVRTLQIPNWHSLVIIGCFFPAWLAMPGLFHGVGQHLGAMAGMFAITYIMFAMGMMGGGDSKLGTALGLWTGLNGMLPFLFYMAIMGGILGVVSLLMHKKKIFKNPKAGSWIEQAQQGGRAVPYGVAISFGSWMAFFHTGLIYNQLNEVIKIIH